MSENVHFKGLNGIRAIAAISVVLSHAALSLDLFGLQKINGFDFAIYGVTMFFSLSGFLITYLLLSEKMNFKKVDIKKFYIRRILRIWPLYFLFLSLAIATTWVYEPQSLPGSLTWYLILGANVPFIFSNSLPLLTHYWSLGVEEQFYLFWPWLIRQKKNIFKAISIFLLLWMIGKLIAWIIFRKTGNTFPYMILDITRFDCMAIGALGAILFFEKRKFFLRICFSYATQTIAWVLLGLIAFKLVPFYSFFIHEVISVLIVFVIINVSSNPKSIIKLNNIVFDFLGKVSYGIYVFHPLVIFFLAKLMTKMTSALNGFSLLMQPAFIFIISLLVTIFVAAVSYYFFEKRFLLLKRRYSKVISTA
ncbi:MAG: acyltransferase family protein [Chitinophagaceae bacterium]